MNECDGERMKEVGEIESGDKSMIIPTDRYKRFRS